MNDCEKRGCRKFKLVCEECGSNTIKYKFPDEWISVKERLPELKHKSEDGLLCTADPVLAYDGKQMGIAHHWQTEDLEYFTTRDPDDEFEKITHWMPLPEPPHE